MTTIDTTFIESISFDMMKEALLSYLLALWDKDPVILGGIILVVFLIVSMSIFKMFFRIVVIAILLSMTISFVSPTTEQPAFLVDMKTRLYNWLLEMNSAYTGTTLTDVNATELISTTNP